jgi:hypothetical protein
MWFMLAFALFVALLTLCSERVFMAIVWDRRDALIDSLRRRDRRRID